MPDRSFVGRYALVVFESDTRGFAADDKVAVADIAELPRLKPLLAAGDHEGRIRLGDLCILIRDNHENPVGLQWINRNSHQDHYLGRLSDPGGGPAYVNQTQISEASRGHGLGRRLMAGTLAIADESGIERLRLCVDRNNVSMLGLCRSMGFEEVGNQYGLRLGPLTLRLNRLRREDR